MAACSSNKIFWVWSIIILTLLPLNGSAQHYYFPIQRDITLQVDKSVSRDSNFVHSGAKPIKMSRVNLDLMDMYGTDKREYYFRAEEMLLSDHVIGIRKKDFEVFVDPLFNFQYGFDLEDSLRSKRNRALTTNTRGVRVQGTIAQKVSFNTSFYENQALFAPYVNAQVRDRMVSPGFGRVKFGDNVFDYAMASGVVVVAPTDFVTVQYGHDKNFIGHGYRSLLLSDNSFNYPHLKLTWNVWKNRIQYTSAFGKVETMNRIPPGETPEAIFQPKGFSFNYLSFMPWRFLEIGLFESFVWKMYDAQDGRLPFNAATINPVIMTNTLARGLADENNGILGLNLRAQITGNITLYSQMLLDDPGNNKFGYQFGFKWFDVFPNFELQAEYNRVSPFTYGTANPLHSYTHNNEYFAHPLGAGFHEIMGFANYRWRRLMAELKVQYATYQQDYRTSDDGVTVRTHFGREILRPETAHTPHLDPNPASHVMQDFRISFVVNPSYNLMINGGVTNRHVFSANYQSNTTFFYIGLRTYLHNQYFDF